MSEQTQEDLEWAGCGPVFEVTDMPEPPRDLSARKLFAVSANIANFTMALSAAATIRLNRKVLPKEFRPAVWREVVLILNVLFFGFFFTMFITRKVLGIKF